MRLRACIYWIGLAALVGCRNNTPREGSKSKTSETIEVSDAASKRRQGIDFTASGGQPSWVLDIDFAKTTRFRAVGTSTLTFNTPKPQRAGSNGGVLLEAKADGKRLRITIDPTVCRSAGSGAAAQEFAYSVRVEASGKIYNGCGSFLRGASRLNDTWTLETFRGQRLRSEQFASNRLPYLEINVKDRQLNGFTGCNPLKGTVQATGDQVRIDPAATARRGCGTRFEDDFLKALRSATLYRIGKNRLTLLANGQYVMTFRKTGN